MAISTTFKQRFLAVGTLAGAIIGAGMFALPYLFRETGLLWSSILLFLGGLSYSLLHLLYADVIVRTPGGPHAFVGYVHRYLGLWWGRFTILMAVCEMTLVLTVYLILSISFSSIVAGFVPPLVSLLFFWILGSVLFFLPTRGVAFFESWASWAMLLLIGGVFFVGFGKPLLTTAPSVSFSSLFSPLAPIFFALSGRVAIPTVIGLLRGARKGVEGVIVAGTLLPAALYALFVFGVLGISREVTPDAVTGLIGSLSAPVLFSIGLLGLVALITSYLLVGVDVRSTLRFDLRRSRLFSTAFVVAAPLLLYFARVGSFLEIISFVGGVFLSLEALFIIALWVRSRDVRPKEGIFSHPPHALLLFFLALLFFFTLLYQLFS